MQATQKSAVLIVDDVPTNIKVLMDLLDESGFDISVAKSGESALEKVQKVSPDLILLDIMMPGIDGFETCSRLKANPQTKDIPVIFMTALSDPVDKVKGLQLGAVDYITKPIHQEEVLARINVHLELRKARLRLVQEEKMASLGQLVAGIAHEINNPINFIQGNLSHAQNYSQVLLEVVELYETQADPTSEIELLLEQADLAFIKADLPQLLSSMEIGTRRIQEMVRSLRIFSRLDEAEYKTVDIQAGIKSALMLLGSRLKAKPHHPAIVIKQEYAELPLIECYAGQLNQVFMHLLTNAIDAIEDKIKHWEIPANPALQNYVPILSIRTMLSDDRQWVSIQVADNGIGMSEEVQRRMFDQFFTTKLAGRGTGLGMAIVRQIVVEAHKGTITVNSILEQGSEITVNISVQAVGNNLNTSS
jgi:two-component system, NtrC family, sensor kinase